MTKQEPVTITPSGLPGRFLVTDILPVLISANDSLHEQLGKQIGWTDNPAKYVRDFRTIRLSMGIRMGHVAAIGLFAKPGDLVVEVTDEMALETCSQTAPGVTCIGRRMLRDKFHTFRPYPTIWLSSFNLWPRTSMNEVRERLIKNSDQRMIILG